MRTYLRRNITVWFPNNWSVRYKLQIIHFGKYFKGRSRGNTIYRSQPLIYNIYLRGRCIPTRIVGYNVSDRGIYCKIRDDKELKCSFRELIIYCLDFARWR